MIPEITCPECSREYIGWALNYMKCYCECGYWLNWDLYIPKI